MGCNSPPGSDAVVNDMGIAFGHAYSILDVFEVEENKLLQIRNPWGTATEWKGAWSDKSSDWTERRKQIIYDRMSEYEIEQITIGADDGTFWISYVDWFTNFSRLELCKYFDCDYTELNLDHCWSNAKKTAGGCINHESYPDNP
jgi:hypothetical protein